MPDPVSPTDRIRGHTGELFAQAKRLPEILEDIARPGSRNGYREATVKTTAGPVTLSRPKLRGTTEKFASWLFGSHVAKTNVLETLVIASFVRGPSVRDVEAALAEALGDQAAISKSTVSAVCRTTCSWMAASFGCTASQPELLSPSYRNRVRKLSPRNQNRSVEHLSAIPEVLLVTRRQLWAGPGARR